MLLTWNEADRVACQLSPRLVEAVKGLIASALLTQTVFDLKKRHDTFLLHYLRNKIKDRYTVEAPWRIA